jgi:uncharacterized protein
MRWTPGGEESPDIEDRRGEDGGGGGGFGGGGGGGFGFGPRHIGIGGFIVLLVLSLLFKRNFFALLGGGGPVRQPAAQTAPGTPPADRSPEEKRSRELVSFVLDDVQNTWTKILASSDHPYHHAKLVLFDNATSSGCGQADASTGPFYCPADEKVYIDLSFYQELKDRFGAPGEFAQAYVLAHEVGHHVQNILGIERQMRRLQGSDSRHANQYSVDLELQADCLAGVWAHSTGERGILEKGDVDSALGAAAAVGDDRLQKQATGGIRPESWTHGSSAQRKQWFETGYESGDLNRCDTFSAHAGGR